MKMTTIRSKDRYFQQLNKAWAILLCISMIIILSACGRLANNRTVQKELSENHSMPSKSDALDTPTPLLTVEPSLIQEETDENAGLNATIEAFLNDFSLDKGFMGNPVLFDINNDRRDEIILYNSKYKEKEDGLSSSIIAVYNADTHKLISQLELSADYRLEVRAIHNPKHYNCLAIATGSSGFRLNFYRLDGQDLISFDYLDGEEMWKLAKLDNAAYEEEIITLEYNQDFSSENKFIAVLYVWDGEHYVKRYESTNTDIDWNNNIHDFTYEDFIVD